MERQPQTMQYLKFHQVHVMNQLMLLNDNVVCSGAIICLHKLLYKKNMSAQIVLFCVVSTSNVYLGSLAFNILPPVLNIDLDDFFLERLRLQNSLLNHDIFDIFLDYTPSGPKYKI